ncbi:MAG: hypothetical protein H6707_10580 [Deltaproteobacteria bacterium]|nr:hypothetical protein [Deltaproteobacteria bacterium]
MALDLIHQISGPLAEEAESDFERGLFAVLDKLLANERDQLHELMGGFLQATRDAPLSPSGKLYALLLSCCLVAHLEVPLTVTPAALQRLLRQAYSDLQQAIAAGEVPAEV